MTKPRTLEEALDAASREWQRHDEVLKMRCLELAVDVVFRTVQIAIDAGEKEALAKYDPSADVWRDAAQNYRLITGREWDS